MIRVLAVDDHPLLREGIAALISTEEDMETCSENFVLTSL
jgi:DNA-binding NarL/FixJ family response regulator